MDSEEKIRCLIALLNEVTSSQDLGETCAHIMDVDEEDLWEITSFGINILIENLNKEKQYA